MPVSLSSMIDRNTPFRLAEAAAIAFPNGGMTVSGFAARRHAAAQIERLPNKDYCTLAAIDDMRALCLVPPKALASGSGPRRQTMPVNSPADRPGSSATEGAVSPQAALEMKLEKLKGVLPPT